MPHPTGGYALNGKRIPGVTTVIGRFKDAGGLLNWYHKLGLQKKNPGKEARRAADAGTACHELIENYLARRKIHKDKLYKALKLDAEQRQWSDTSYSAFLCWHKETQPRIEEMEVRYVSADLKCGGTPDAVGRLMAHTELYNKRIMLDWKTSNSMSSDHTIQVATYVAMWEEEHGERLDGFLIVRFDKKDGSYEEKYISREDAEPYIGVFRSFRSLYSQLDKLGILYYRKK